MDNTIRPCRCATWLQKSTIGLSHVDHLQDLLCMLVHLLKGLVNLLSGHFGQLLIVQLQQIHLLCLHHLLDSQHVFIPQVAAKQDGGFDKGHRDLFSKINAIHDEALNDFF